MNTFDISIK